MPEDIKAIDVMNYVHYFIPEERTKMFASYEWKVGFQSTFKTMGPAEKAAKLMGLASYEDFLKEIDEAGYDKVILSSLKQWSLVNSTWVVNTSIDMIKDFVDRSKGKIVGGVGYNPLRIEDSLKELDKAIKQYGFKYIYVHPQGFGLPPNDRRYYPAYVKALEYGIPIGFQTGHSAEAMPSDPGRPLYFDEVAIQWPSVNFVLSHTGWPWVDEWIDMVWKHPNVYGDISAYPPRSLPEKEKIVAFIDSWRGVDKVMWGTNSLGLKLKAQFMEMTLKDDTKRKILRDNAVKLFKL
ncbi:MAG: amidohydrolase [Chloroflexi bacterium]|nr:amidohydrolase [Chloroflexota bacterium]